MKKIMTSIIPPRVPRILYIGSKTTNPGQVYYNVLRSSGFDIFHVGLGGTDLDLTNIDSQNQIFRNEFGQVKGRVYELKLTTLFELIGKRNFDLIFHVQDWITFTDQHESPIPYFYYCTEAAFPIVPRSAWICFVATKTIKDLVFRSNPRLRGVVYHGHSALVKPMLRGLKFGEHERTLKSSFAGEIYKLQELYSYRRKIVQHCKKTVPTFNAHYLESLQSPVNGQPVIRKPEAGKGVLNHVQYTKLLHFSQIGLNVPTPAGANFRDIEVPAHGAILATIRTPDHDLLGFQDGVNCRYYYTPEEAEEIIKTGYDPKIAEEGWKLIMFGRSWWRHKHGKMDYIGTEIVEGKNTMVLRIFKELIPLIKEELQELKNIEKILRWKFDVEREEVRIDIKDQSYIENVLPLLGFQHSTVKGHTIYHRVADLCFFFKKYAGISIPQRVQDNIPQP